MIPEERAVKKVVLEERRKVCLCTLAALIITLLFVISAESASASTVIPGISNNISGVEIGKSALIKTGEGYTRIYGIDDTKVYRESYDKNFRIKGRKAIPMELPLYGGFFEGRDAYYLLFGKMNTAENDSAEVYRVVKYNKNWQRIGAARITSRASETRHPFNFATPNMAEHDGYLYFVTGRQGYVDESIGQGHQGFLMYKINESSMTGTLIDSDLYHSFSQNITIDESGRFFILEESEGNEMALLSKGDAEEPRRESISVLDYGGVRSSCSAVRTYAKTNGVAYSKNKILTVGWSIDQSRYYDTTYDHTYNVYLTTTPIDNFTEKATTFRWITKCNAEEIDNVKLTKVSNDRFMISWSVEEEKGSLPAGCYSAVNQKRLHYIFVNGNGSAVSREFVVCGSVSDCDPLVDGNKIIFYSSDNGSIVFFSIDSSTGRITRKEYLMAGENAEWSLKNGVLTISGNGKLSEDLAKYAFKAIKKKVKKIVIKKGITAITNCDFVEMPNVREVFIEDGLKTIGVYGITENKNMTKITIPASVKYISKYNFGNGGFVGDLPNVTATIYCYRGSYAHKFAKKYNINYRLLDNHAKPGTSMKKADSVIRSWRSDKDISGSAYSMLLFRSTSAKAKYIDLRWKKVSGARKYVIYGNRCGAKNRLKKLRTVKGSKYRVKKVAGKSLAKDKYYKFVLVAVDSKGKVVSTSKTIHVATTKAKAGNHKAVKTKVKTKTVRKGKSFKLGAKTVPVSKKRAVKKHVAIRYESAKRNVATVSRNGTVRAKAKGSCYVYAYAQNGVYKRVKVTVK